MIVQKESSSFRDPSGQVYIENGIYRRLINSCYLSEYQQLMESGLYKELTGRKLLIPHTEVATIGKNIIIEPEQIEFTSYPYEWCFSILKQAALNTLKINITALEYGMMLKDASAFNMQWYQGNMVLIDTLSFMKYENGMPWGAYPQFLRHFLNPLLLMKYQRPVTTSIDIDGNKSQQTAKMLPLYLALRPSYLAHLYSQSLNVAVRGQKTVKMPIFALKSLLNTLKTLIYSLNYKPKSTWTDYTDGDSYSTAALESKQSIVREMLWAGGETLCDIGANTGEYSKLACINGYKVIAIDSDAGCVEQIGMNGKRLPLVVDICNPTPAIGWDNTERKSFLNRLHVDVIMALAIIHHICIGNNVPLEKVARLFSEHCKRLIVEFVPPADPKAQLLARNHNFPTYDMATFETEFSKYFNTLLISPIEDSKRTMFLMEVKNERKAN